MSIDLKKFWTLYGENEKKVTEFHEEDSESLREVIQTMSKIFNAQKNPSFSKILDLLVIFMTKLGMPFIIVLNEFPILKSLIEYVNNTDRELPQVDKKTLFEIWRLFFSRFKNLLKTFPDISEIAQFIELDYFLEDKFPIDYAKAKEKNDPKLSDYDKMFLVIFEKNLQAKQVLQEKNPTSGTLYEVLQSFKAIKTAELFGEDFTNLEGELLRIQAKKTESLKEDINRKDPTLKLKLYKQMEKTLHNCEYYVAGTEYSMKNDLTTHFIEDVDVFFDQYAFRVKKLLCGFFNAKGGRIYLGLEKNRIVGLILNKKGQDTIRLQIDEMVRGFHPLVQAEEMKTLFYPVVNSKNNYEERYIVKILINPNFSEVYFTPKPDPQVYNRNDDGTEYLYTNWQEHFLEGGKENIKYNDPLPLDPNEIESLTFKEASHHRIPPPFYPTNYAFGQSAEKERPKPKEENFKMPPNDKNKLKNDRNRMEIEDPQENFKNHKNRMEIEEPLKEKENEIKRLLDLKDNTEKKKSRNQKRDYERFYYKALLLKYDSAVKEKEFLDSTIAISEYLNDNNTKLELQFRRRDKKYFFVESGDEFDDEVLNQIKEIYGNEEKVFKVSFPKKDVYKKQKGFVILKPN